MAGVTDGGFVPRTQAELERLIKERLSGNALLEKFNFDEGPLHQLVGVLSDHLAQLWEAGEEIYASAYAGASGLSLDRVAGLTGTTRRAATRSLVTTEVTLNAGITLPAGSIAAVSGDPDSQFRTTEDATNSGGAPAAITVVMESVETGPVAAPLGTLTVIVTPVTGWTAVDNGTAKADLGRIISDDVELRTSRLAELFALGSGTLGSMRAAVAKLEGVESVQGRENVTSATVDGLPMKSFEIVLWDGSPTATEDDDIAQAIFDHAPSGIEPFGSSSGTATDDDGPHTVAFSRATQVRVYVDATVVLEPGTASGWETEAAAAIAGVGFVVAESVYASRLSCVLQALDSVRAVTALTVDTVDPPVAASVAISTTQIADIQTTDVDLTT